MNIDRKLAETLLRTSEDFRQYVLDKLFIGDSNLRNKVLDIIRNGVENKTKILSIKELGELSRSYELDVFRASFPECDFIDYFQSLNEKDTSYMRLVSAKKLYEFFA